MLTYEQKHRVIELLISLSFEKRNTRKDKETFTGKVTSATELVYRDRYLIACANLSTAYEMASLLWPDIKDILPDMVVREIDYE